MSLTIKKYNNTIGCVKEILLNAFENKFWSLFRLAIFRSSLSSSVIKVLKLGDTNTLSYSLLFFDTYTHVCTLIKEKKKFARIIYTYKGNLRTLSLSWKWEKRKKDCKGEWRQHSSSEIEVTTTHRKNKSVYPLDSPYLSNRKRGQFPSNIMQGEADREIKF